ncbi:hypothetical protein JCM5350_004690 [Sporobolomyces pararoseus]
MYDLEAATEVGWGGTRARAGVEVERGGGVTERPAEVVRGELATGGSVGVATQVEWWTNGKTRMANSIERISPLFLTILDSPSPRPLARLGTTTECPITREPSH